MGIGGGGCPMSPVNSNLMSCIIQEDQGVTLMYFFANMPCRMSLSFISPMSHVDFNKSLWPMSLFFSSHYRMLPFPIEETAVSSCRF